MTFGGRRLTGWQNRNGCLSLVVATDQFCWKDGPYQHSSRNDSFSHALATSSIFTTDRLPSFHEEVDILKTINIGVSMWASVNQCNHGCTGEDIMIVGREEPHPNGGGLRYNWRDAQSNTQRFLMTRHALLRNWGGWDKRRRWPKNTGHEEKTRSLLSYRLSRLSRGFGVLARITSVFMVFSIREEEGF